jgi:hypothetical protein
MEKAASEAPPRRSWASLGYSIVYRAVAALFAVCGVLLVGFAGVELYHGVAVRSLELKVRFDAVLEAIGMLTIAVAALELSQTVWEEEVQRRATMSAPTRVRRFLSRFLIVVVVALAIEALIAAFRFAHDEPEHLPHAAAIAIGAAVLLLAWGVFVRLNLAAEAVEPDAMERAKQEDEQLDENIGES